MDTPMLACGPYFTPDGMVTSLAIFLVIKPFAYFAYVRAFRYRVSREIPMTHGQAVKLALLRAVVGVVLVGGGAWCLAVMGQPLGGALPWGYLYGARVVAWLVIGRSGAGLRGGRLAAWTVGGLLINVAFDAATVVGLLAGWLYPTGIVLLVVGFIAIVEARGKRAALTSRFSSDPRCGVCTYNLTGNLSGICPECGTPIPEQVPS